MAIVFKEINIKFDSCIINGVMGDYEKLFRRLTGNNLCFYQIEKEEKEKLANLYSREKILPLLEELSLKEDFINTKYVDLSSGEKSLFKLIKVFLSDKKILILDEPFIYLDAYYVKKVMVIIKRIIYHKRKTVIIGSSDSNLIYQICKKVLLIKDNNYFYEQKEKLFISSDILEKYDIIVPDIIKFHHLAEKKKIQLEIVDDIRDLIKEVYRHV